MRTIKEPARPEVFLCLAGIALVLAVTVANLVELYYVKRSAKGERLGGSRIYSLDTFRGISLFWMIFFNYGSGGYKFLQHADWHGLTPAGNCVRRHFM